MTEPVRRYPALDALRGIAALGVILHHTRALASPGSDLLSKMAEGGARGVQYFFVLSAFSLCLSLRGRIAETHRLWNYFIRRLFRIAPLWWFAVALYTWMSFAGISSSESAHWWQIVLAATFLQGWHPDAISSVVGGGWAIAVETSFYFLLPWLFFRLGTILESLKWFLGLLLLENILRRVLINVMPGFFPGIGLESFRHFSDFWLISQLPIFLLGIMAYWGYERLRMINADLRRWLIILCGAVLVAFVSVTTYKNLIKNDVLYGVVFALLVPLVMDFPVTSLLGRLSLYLGKISYSLYLMHGVAISLLLLWRPSRLLAQGDANYLLAYSVVVVMTIAMASLTYFLIEEPGQRFGKRFLRHA